MGKLTALAVKAAKEPGSYQDGDGLILVVKSSGARSWVLRMQVNGKRRDFGLGSAKKVSLSKARDKADETRRLYSDGIDPVKAKKAALAAENEMPTFFEAAETVHREQKDGWRNPKHAAQWISSLETYAKPFIGDTPLDEIDAPSIRDLLIPIWLSKPETARRVKQRIGAVLDWGHAKGFRSAEAPMRSIGKGLPKQPKRDAHYSAMPYPDIPALMTKLSETDSIGRLALRFLILTAARSGEVRGATWSEIDLDKKLWTVPKERMKAGREHVVPLPEAALSILNAAEKFKRKNDDSLVFPGIKLTKPMSDMTLTKVLRDLDISYTVHGFRSSFRDWAAEKTDYAGDVVEAALAHTIQNKVEAAYRRTNYLEKRKLVMASWGMFLAP